MDGGSPSATLVAILPCNDLDRSERFYSRLGFAPRDGEGDASYRILANEAGGCLHLRLAEQGWLVPGCNPFGLYLYVEDVDGLAVALRDLWLGGRGPDDKPWGMYEFALSDPDGTLVRIGWPSRLRHGHSGRVA